MKRQRKLKCILLTEIITNIIGNAYYQSEKATLNELYDSLRCNGKTWMNFLANPIHAILEEAKLWKR